MTLPMDHGQPLSGRIAAAPPPARLGEEEIDIMGFARLLRRRIRLIALTAGVLVALQIPLILTMESTYFAQLRLLINRAPTANLAAPDAPNALPLDLTLEVERLLSQKNALRVVEAFDLASLEEFNPPPSPSRMAELLDGLRARLTAEPPPAQSANADPQDIVLANFYSALSVRRNGSTNVFEIGFRSRDPVLAAKVPNALVEVYLDARGDQLREQVATADQWLDRRIMDQRERVAGMEAATNAFRRENGPNSANLQLEGINRISALTTRQSEILRSAAEMRALLSELRAGRALAAPSDGPVAEPAVIAGIRRDLQLQQRDLARLLRVYGENYSEVVDMRSAIQETEAALANELASYAETVSARVRTLEQEQAVVAAELEAAREGLSRMAFAETEYEVMQLDLERERETLVALELQQRTLATEGLLPLAEAEVLSPASVPRHPDGRGRKFFLIAGTIGALAIAVTLACLAEMLDRSLRSQQQVAAIPRARPAGLIPALSARRHLMRARSVLQRQEPAYADAIGWLLLSLEQSASGRVPRAMLVTSAMPGEGKSVVALAMAAELAQRGQRVLLVDCDLWCGRLHEAFGATAGPGLADCQSGATDVATVIRHDAASGIDYIPRGTSVGKVAPALPRISEILQHGRETNQIVIFDTAPVLATTATSALAGMGIRSVLVAHWGRTPKAVAELAVERLVSAGAETVFVALNQVNPRKLAGYGYSDAELFSRNLRKYRAAV